MSIMCVICDNEKKTAREIRGLPFFRSFYRFIILKENFATIPVIRNSYEVL